MRRRPVAGLRFHTGHLIRMFILIDEMNQDEVVLDDNATRFFNATNIRRFTPPVDARTGRGA